MAWSGVTTEPKAENQAGGLVSALSRSGAFLWVSLYPPKKGEGAAPVLTRGDGWVRQSSSVSHKPRPDLPFFGGAQLTLSFRTRT
jgi:hypothetical protein